MSFVVKNLSVYILLLFCVSWPGVLCAKTVTDTPAVNGFNLDWQFMLNDSNAPLKNPDTLKGWQNITLPHDWSIRNIPQTTSPFSSQSVDKYDTGYTQGGIGWYRKLFYLPTELTHKTAVLTFGGIYMNATIWVNGHPVEHQYYGYTPFWLDITEHLKFGEQNVITVKVNNNHLNSRWYSGSGIYRQASLSFQPKVHFNQWDTAVKTLKATDNRAKLAISTTIVNKRAVNKPTTASLVSQFFNNDNELVHETQTTILLDKQLIDLSFTADIKDPELWSPEQPSLYTLKQRLTVDGKAPSRQQVQFGIRTVTFRAQQGMLLNNKPVLLKGMNIHHDNYMLGAEAHQRAEQRKVEKILAAGFNAVRTAHNPPSEYFLEASDKLGLLVIAEAFDGWNRSKFDHINDYSARFKQDWRKDLARFIKRDRNHPSIIMWSIGNEIPEQNEALGAETAATLKRFVLSLDDSREVTIGANTSGSISDPFLSNFDVVGYNYQEKNYLSDHQRFSERLMYGSESYSNRAFDYWQYVKAHPFIIGDFVWTGWDYLGEASIGWTGYAPQWQGLAPYPWHIAYCGELDVLGYKQPAAYYRDVLWDTGKHKISAFVESPQPSLQPTPDPSWYLYWQNPDIHPSWTWPIADSTPVNVIVYSVFEQVELFVNGQSFGKKDVSTATEFKANYLVPYKPGELKAVGYVNNEKAGEWILETAESAAKIKLSVERNEIHADGKDIAYVTAELFDTNDRRVYHWDQDKLLNIAVSGPGHLLAVGNGNPTDVTSFQASTRKTFKGRLVAVIQSSKGKSGKIAIKVSGKGLISDTIEISAR